MKNGEGKGNYKPGTDPNLVELVIPCYQEEIVHQWRKVQEKNRFTFSKQVTKPQQGKTESAGQYELSYQ